MPSSSYVGLSPLRVERARFKIIMSLALPIIGGMGSQTLLNLVDTFMVSRLGKDAVAAVGMASFVNFLLIAFIIGMSSGVQAMASRRKGEGRDSETAIPLNGSLLMVLGMSIPLTLVLVLAAPIIIAQLNRDPKVIEIASPYLQVRLIGMLAVGCNYSFRGYWNGVSMSRLYLRTLLVMHVSNVVLSYMLIFGVLGAPELGATGAAAGTTISTYIGTIYYFLLARRYASHAGFLRGLPGMDIIKSMLRLSIPSGLQQLFFAAGFTVLFTIIGIVGTTELAAASVLVNVGMAAILPGLGLGLAAASLVGQALGRSDPRDAQAWGWDVTRVAMLIVLVVGLLMLLFPTAILGLFFADEPAALAVAALPLRLVGATIILDIPGLVLLNAVIGAGATRLAMLVSVLAQWAVFLPAAYLVGPVLGFGLLGIWITQIVYRVGQSAVFVAIWRSQRWANINV